MQILSLDLENTKSYEKAHIEFTLGVNAIVGHNGAGKSTILEAIGLAVFDSIDYRQNDFVNSTAKSATVTVSILSSLDQRRYQVVRRIGSSNQHYIYDPELEARVCEGKADVLAFLRQHLGVEPGTDLTALFRDAVGVSQGTFTAAFLETPARRKPIFDSLLQVQEYQRAYDRLREPLNLLRERQQAMEVELATLTARLERLPELRDGRTRKQRELKEVRARLQQVMKELAEAEEQRRTLEAIRSEVTDLMSKATQLAERVESVSGGLAAARQSLRDAEESREVVTRHQAGYAQYLDSQAQQKKLDAQLRERQRLEGERAKLDKSVALGEANLGKLQEALAESRAAEETAKQLEGSVERQKALEASLADARQQQARLKDAQESAQRLRQQLQRLEERLPQMETALARSVKLDEERAATDNQIAELRQTLDGFKDETAQHVVQADAIKEHTKALEDVETAVCPVCEQPLTPAHRSELIARNEERITELRHSYADVQKRTKQQESLLQENERRAGTILSEIRGLPRAEEVTKLNEEIDEHRMQLAQADGRVDELKAAPAQIEKVSQELQVLGNPGQQYAIAQERASRRPTIEQEIETVNHDILKNRQALSELNEALTQFADLDERIEATEANLQSYLEAYQLVLSNQRVAETVEQRKGEVERLAREREDAQHEQAAIAEKLAEVEGKFDADAFQVVVEKEKAARREIGSLQAQSSMLETGLQEDAAQIEALEAVAGDVKAKQAQAQAIVQNMDILTTIRTLLRQAGPYITRALIRQISEGAAQIYGDIMQDYSRHLAWNEEYGITLEVDGHERQFSQLSGGEQMTAALSVRLALLREMSNIDVAFFDEPTTNLDENRRESLARQILAIRGFRQLFVISHDDTFEQATQNLIRVERVNGTSRVQYA